MGNGKRVLLAFGEGALNQAVRGTLQDAGFKVTQLGWTEGVRLPKSRYDYLIQLGKNPAALTEGTRRLLEKAKKEEAEFLLISSLKVVTKTGTAREATYLESLHFAEALTEEFYKKYGLETTILRLPTTFGPNIPLAESGTLGHLISEFIEGTVLTVYGEGADEDYYLYLTDAAEAVKLALTTEGRERGIYFATPSAPLPSATAAEILKEMGGERHEIHYHKGLAALEERVKLEGKALPHFKPQVPMKEGILQTLKALPTDKADSSDEGKRKLSIKIPRFRRPSQKRVLQLTAIFLILSPLLYIGGQASLAVYHLSQLRRQIGAFDFQTASRSADAARANFVALSRFSGSIPFLSKRTPLRDLGFLSQGGGEASTALKELLAEGEILLTAFENLFKSYQGEAIAGQTEEEFNHLATAFKEAEDKLLAAWLYLNQTHPSFRQLLNPYSNLLQEGLTAAKLGAAFAGKANDLLGYQGERSYLILFQNSAEARAGGGFLGSLAQLTLENGGIKTLEFFDSYQFDSTEEKARVPAPAALQKFRGVGTLPLREANFYASFPESGRNITKIFETVQGVEIDGVLGINLLLAKELINITGPLELTDFERTIAADNLFEVTTEEVEKEFFPGSTKKKRFLQALGEGLLNNLFALKKEDYVNLVKVVWEGLGKGDILPFFEEGSLAQALIESGFDGRVKSTKGDFLMVLDTSFGTKTNLSLVKRTVDYKIFNPTRADELAAELTITWTHSGTEAWPSGTYKNLFRALVPKGSRLTKATLNNENYLPKIFITEEAGKTEFAAYFYVKPQTTATLKLSYRLPSSLNLKNPTTYQLTVQKQPGTIGDPFTFTFEEPFGKRISGEASSAIASSGVAGEGLQREGNNLIFKKDLERDIILEVAIEEKEE